MSIINLRGTIADERLCVWETDRGDWRALEENDEAVLALLENRTLDWRSGTVAIAGDRAWRDYEYSLDLYLLPHADGSGMAWPGVIVRAKDTDNYEAFWFMPHLDDASGNVAYLSVAHGIVPWWTDSYVSIPRGRAPYSPGEWLPISVRVEGLQATVRVRNEPDPILTVRLSYYLDGGCVGVYCGTETSAKFRRMRIDLLAPKPLPDPPSLAPR